MEDSEIIGKEFRFGFHLSAIPDVRRDTHVVKEVIHYKDGTSKPHLRIIENFKRPFWITKEHYQKHKDKKECELLDRVTQYTATESGLARAVLTRLGSRYNGKKTLRDALPSPYIYGLDVSGLTMMKYYYSKKYPDFNTPYTMCALDTEVDIDTGELLILSVCTTDNIYVTILDRMVENRNNPEEQLKYLYDKYIPDCDLKEKINVTFDICTDELQMIVNAFKKVHEWQPDFLAIWNISYDMEVLLKVLEKSEVDPKDIFSDPSLPPELREFKFVKGQIQKVTESGVLKPLEPREQWHTVKCPASFYWIDAMSAYHFVRVGTKNVPGGYSLDNILTTELGEGYKKLKFKDEVAEYLDGPDWHKYMVAKRPLEYIIYNCWNIIYYLPPIRYGKHMVISIVSVVSMTGTIVLATIYSCIYALREVPASLMRPKSPKNGKKIFLEHIGFIWNRLNFSSKVTARNILRYKKRFFMTVVGVAGGCALMYAGFAIKDSISALIKKQFEEIIKYDLSINYETDDAKKEVISNPKLTNSIVISEYTGMASSSDNSDSDVYKEKDNVYIDVTDDTELFMDYITLRKRNTKIVYQLDNEGVCVTEKLAKDLGLKEGNIIYIQGKDLAVKGFKISHIVEMYSNSYIYMTSGLYSQVFGSDPEYNTIYAMVNNVDNETEKNLGREIMDIDGVKGTIFQISNVSTFLDMISTMNLVTYILVISAAALSFVVLYNLTNVNVSERIREIATIKVLGFYDNEVASYVYRENIIISVIGAFAGLFLGMALHNYIMLTLEMENIMFGNAVRPVSFVLSFVITVAFSLFVNITMYGKLKRIPMVESLKAVE